MAVVTTNSNVIQDILDGDKANGALQRGRALVAKSSVVVGATDSATSIYQILTVPSNAYVNELKIYNSALTGGTSYAVGFTTLNADASSAGYINLPTLVSSGLNFTTADEREVRFRNLAANTFESQLWQLLGLDQDYGGEYVLIFTANTPGTVAGYMGALVQYSSI